MISDEVGRLAIHPFNEFITFIDDSFSLPPSQHSGKESHDFYILLQRELVRNHNGVVRNKVGAIVLLDFSIQKSFKVLK